VKGAVSAGTILVIDDEHVVREIVRVMLARHGYKVYGASTPGEAFGLLTFTPRIEIDLVLLDLALPGMNGGEVAAVIGQLRPELPVLFMTGQVELGAAVQIGNAPLITKPFTSIALVGKIEWVRRGGQSKPHTV
jgi:CheY-like chemotaxis protein